MRVLCAIEILTEMCRRGCRVYVRGSDIKKADGLNIKYIVPSESPQVGMGSPQRTHLLPFTRCDRGMTQQIPFYQSLALSHLEIPDSITVLPPFCSFLLLLPGF